MVGVRVLLLDGNFSTEMDANETVLQFQSVRFVLALTAHLCLPSPCLSLGSFPLLPGSEHSWKWWRCPRTPLGPSSPHSVRLWPTGPPPPLAPEEDKKCTEMIIKVLISCAALKITMQVWKHLFTFTSIRRICILHLCSVCKDIVKLFIWLVLSVLWYPINKEASPVTNFCWTVSTGVMIMMINITVYHNNSTRREQ